MRDKKFEALNTLFNNIPNKAEFVEQYNILYKALNDLRELKGQRRRK